MRHKKVPWVGFREKPEEQEHVFVLVNHTTLIERTWHIDHSRYAHVASVGAAWPIVRLDVEWFFDNLLRAKKLPEVRWNATELLFDRLAGRMLAVLWWTLEQPLTQEQASRASQKWKYMRPETLLTLYTLAVGDHYWRRCLVIGLAEADELARY